MSLRPEVARVKAPLCQSCQNPLPPPGALPLDYAMAVTERVLSMRHLRAALIAKARKGRKEPRP